MPARTASSTTSWIVGTSTIGSISLGTAFVAGRNRVPSPAAGITAFLTLCRGVMRHGPYHRRTGMADDRPFPPSPRRRALARQAGLHAASPLIVGAAAATALVIAAGATGRAALDRL